MVVPQFVTGLAPAPMGGTLTDGKWVLTAYTIYSANGNMVPVPEWARTVWVAKGSDLEEAYSSRSEGFTHADEHASYTFATMGSALTISGTCPGPVSGTSGTLPFTGSATELKIYDAAFQGITVETTLTKQ